MHVLLPEAQAEGNRTCIELFPIPREKYSGLLTDQTLNNCIISFVINFGQNKGIQNKYNMNIEIKHIQNEIKVWHIVT